jgi:hypothetical protein
MVFGSFDCDYTPKSMASFIIVVGRCGNINVSVMLP